MRTWRHRWQLVHGRFCMSHMAFLISISATLNFLSSRPIQDSRFILLHVVKRSSISCPRDPSSTRDSSFYILCFSRPILRSWFIRLHCVSLNLSGHPFLVIATYPALVHHPSACCVSPGPLDLSSSRDSSSSRESSKSRSSYH